jgi:hypothetical protein
LEHGEGKHIEIVRAPKVLDDECEDPETDDDNEDDDDGDDDDESSEYLSSQDSVHESSQVAHVNPKTSRRQHDNSTASEDDSTPKRKKLKSEGVLGNRGVSDAPADEKTGPTSVCQSNSKNVDRLNVPVVSQVS